MTYKTIAVVAAVDEPVTLNDGKSQLRIEDSFTLDDAYISSLISVARDRAENYCNRFFTEQVIKIIFDEDLPQSEIALPYPNLKSVDSLQYVQDGVLTTIDSSYYYVDLDRQRITVIGSWPVADNYRMVVTTGAPVELGGVKQAMMLMVTDMYELRTETVLGVSIAINPAVHALLYPYRENLGI